MIMNGVMIGNHVNTAAKLGKKSKITVKLHIKNSVMAIFPMVTTEPDVIGGESLLLGFL